LLAAFIFIAVMPKRGARKAGAPYPERLVTAPGNEFGSFSGCGYVREQYAGGAAIEHPGDEIGRSFAQPDEGGHAAQFGGYQRVGNVIKVAKAMFEIDENKIRAGTAAKLDHRRVQNVHDRAEQCFARVQATLDVLLWHRSCSRIAPMIERQFQSRAGFARLRSRISAIFAGL
jgi:hypothetical protein